MSFIKRFSFFIFNLPTTLINSWNYFNASMDELEAYDPDDEEGFETYEPEYQCRSCGSNEVINYVPCAFEDKFGILLPVSEDPKAMLQVCPVCNHDERNINGS